MIVSSAHNPTRSGRKRAEPMIIVQAGSHMKITDSETAEVEASTCNDTPNDEIDHTVTVA